MTVILIEFFIAFCGFILAQLLVMWIDPDAEDHCPCILCAWDRRRKKRKAGMVG